MIFIFNSYYVVKLSYMFPISFQFSSLLISNSTHTANDLNSLLLKKKNHRKKKLRFRKNSCDASLNIYLNLSIPVAQPIFFSGFFFFGTLYVMFKCYSWRAVTNEMNQRMIINNELPFFIYLCSQANYFTVYKSRF